MKKRILIALTFLTGVFLYSCSTSKKTSSDQSKIEKPAIVSAKEVETDVKKVEPVNLPETKEELGFVKSNYEEEEENRGDFYGTKFNEYKNIPIYDINNLPISVWFIKQKNDYKGFIVAGHATKAVCEVASLEVHNKIKAIGKSESTIFSFGVGYNILDNNESSSSYNEIMQGMKEEFEELEGDNEEQVSVNEIDYTKYVEYQMMFKTHIDLAKQSKGWGTHIVEYKLEDFPIIAPFYYIQNSEKIKVTIPKNYLGKFHLNWFLHRIKKAFQKWKIT
ncbi:MAG: hypothetical protein IPN33_06980 [Saprospiraceae bacterium]|nr:hypothetical protein [Saprospiraceae bacterium]